MKKLFAVLLVACLECHAPSRAEEPDTQTRAGWRDLAQSGSGFVVWESNRTGRWRIWRRELDGSNLRQISPEENGRDHFCPHLSPDGARLVYLSYPAGAHTYQGGTPNGGIWLYVMQADGSGNRRLTDAARAYFEDRAAVWVDPDHFVFIDGQGFTRQMDLRSGQSVKLTTSGQPDHGFLVNATRTHATTGVPTFSLYDPSRSQVTGQNGLGGCQPYFSHDGRWGFWMGGAGGPINRIDLRSRQVSPILNPNDPRMPPNRRYLYFPMVSRDARLFAFAASPSQHDHFTSDYDVFVARMDPSALEVIGKPVRFTFHPGCDRFPDVFQAELELGRLAGEAPYTIELSAGGKKGRWRWDFGDGTQLDGSVGRHTYSRPGRFEVRAAQQGKALRGVVAVAPAAPPRVLSAGLRGERELVVLFDEPIQAGRASARLDSGTPIQGTSVGSDGKSLVLKLASTLKGQDTLHLGGVADRAQRPNTLSTQALGIQPTLWPTNHDGLVFLFETADKPNLVPSAGGRPARSYALHPRGRARLNHDQAMVLTGGAFLAEGADDDLLAALKQSGELTIEAVLRPDHLNQSGPARIVTFSSNAGTRNVTLGQQGNMLILRLRTPSTGENGVNPESVLCPLEAGRPSHVAVTYRPGQLTCFVDGKQVYHATNIQGDFRNWGPQHLLFGDEYDGQRNWAGTLEGVALYGRALAPDEVARNAAQYHHLMGLRKPAPRVELIAHLVAKSPAPTLAEIKPYRDALMVCKYRVSKVLNGTLDGPEILVAQWALLDGQGQPAVALKPGAEARLILEPFEANPQLQRFVCKDGFDGDAELLLPRYYDATP